MKQLENRVLKVTNKIEKSCAFGAIRQGMIMLIPLLVVGYGALMIMSLPIAGYRGFYCTYLVGACYGYVAIYISWCK